MLKPKTDNRDEIPQQYKWDLAQIFATWTEWEVASEALGSGIDEFSSLRGSLAESPSRLLAAFRLSDALGQLACRIWYYPSLWYDQNQRDNETNARRQQVQILLARWQQASAWFKPELLKIPLERVREWMAADSELAVYRFAIENLYRQAVHVLDEAGERLLSLASRFDSSPPDAYSALSTADARFPTIMLSTGEEVKLSYGEYRAILASNPRQEDRAQAFRRFHEIYAGHLNTYAALYNGTCQRDWFHAQARAYPTTLDASLFGNNIPSAVVENLIATTRDGTEPLRRYHRLRKKALGLDSYHIFDSLVSLMQSDRKYPYDEAVEWIVSSVAPLGEAYQRRVREAFEGRWIDVYENDGKRSGAYSAPVYGVHPYMLLNYNDTMEAVFTLAHEMGHSVHTVLSHENQPFVYASYTIFVAEVPSTLSEALLLEFMLAHSPDPIERVVLLQHAIDGIVGTFCTQVLFADFELRVHRLVEQGKPITAEILSEVYAALLDTYYGDVLAPEMLARLTWARIPHFYNSPYYVYQYATCFASAAKLHKEITTGPEPERRAAVDRYLMLLKSGGNDYPMEQLKKAGVDLSRPEAVRAVINQLDHLVTRLEQEFEEVTIVS